MPSIPPCLPLVLVVQAPVYLVVVVVMTTALSWISPAERQTRAMLRPAPPTASKQVLLALALVLALVLVMFWGVRRQARIVTIMVIMLGYDASPPP